MVDLAQVVVRVRDESSAGIQSARTNFQSLNNDLDAFKSKWAALASGLGLAAFAALTKSAIDAQAELYRLSVRTNVSVESLSALKSIAKLSGTDIETVALGVQKLDKAMYESVQGNNAASKAFGALGLSARDASGALKAPDQMMLEIAKSLDTFQDGAGKTAVAIALFGKNGAAMLPVLKDLAAVGELEAKVTTAQAIEAEELHKNIVRLTASKNALFNTIAADLTPALNALLTVILQLSKETGGLKSTVDELSADGTLRAFFEDSARYVAKFIDFLRILAATLSAVWSSFKVVAADAATISVGAFTKMLPGPLQWLASPAFKTVLDERNQILADANKKWADLLDLNTTKTEDAFRRQMEALKIIEKYSGPQFKDARDLRLQGQLTPPPPDDAGKVVDTWSSVIDKLMGIDRVWLNELAALQQALQRGVITQTQYVDLVKKLIPLQKDVAAAMAARDAAEKAAVTSQLAEASALGKEIDALNAKIAATQFENDTYGMSASAIADLSATRLEDRRAQLLTIEGSELQVKALDIEIERYRTLASALRVGEVRKEQADIAKREATEIAGLFSKADRVANDFFTGMLSGERDTIRKFRDAMKRDLFDWLYAQFARPIVIQLVASLLGISAAGTAAANAGGSIVGNVGGSIAGAAANYGATALGYTAGFGGFSEAAAGYTANAAYLAGSAELAPVYGTVAGEVGGAMAGIESALTAMGPYGWVALAIMAIAIYLTGKGGGPKSGGSFLGSFGSSGQMTGDLTGSLDRSQHLHDETQQDSMARDVAIGIGHGYAAALKALGGTSAGMQFGIGFNRDPLGDAPSMVSSLVRDATGRTIFEQQNRNVGRDVKDVSAEIGLQSQRAILAGLQHSDLPKAISSFLNSIVAETATGDEITAALQTAAVIKSIMDNIANGNITDAMDRQAAVTDLLGQALDRNAAPLNAVIDAFDGTAGSVQNLAAVTSQYYLANVQLIAQIRQIRAAVDEMFGNTIRNIQLSVLDPQGKYDFYQNEASTLYSQMMGSTDAAEIQRLASKINDDINAAFGLLSPEEQKAHAQDFITKIQETEAAAHDRLSALEERVNDANTTMLTKVGNLMETYFTKGQEAANTMGDAADTLNGAANQISDAFSRGVDVRVTPQGSEVGA